MCALCTHNITTTNTTALWGEHSERRALTAACRPVPRPLIYIVAGATAVVSDLHVHVHVASARQ